MRSISITAFNRPELLKQIVDSILANDTSGFTHCYCAVEPDKHEENYHELVRLQPRFEFFHCDFNKTTLGVRKNPYTLLSKVFDEGSDFNLYLEDDSLLSPDAFDFVRFYLDNINDSSVMCCNLYNYHSKPNMPTIVKSYNEFCALGMGLNKQQWDTWFKPYWFDENIRMKNKIDIGGIEGWDWSIRAVMKEFSLKVIIPAYSRIFHLGVTGVHCDKYWYDIMFRNHPYSKLKQTKFKQTKFKQTKFKQ
jgi:hypothetical protein